ncbi:RNA polymerase sigma factor [Caenimonas terrae]|uniref:RNA polymerase sigma factor n=1 Tax=Caenimonas terrae TaxID=696074 RepID=A0ABW0NA01_9BURK
MDFDDADKPTPLPGQEPPLRSLRGDAALEERNRALRVMIAAAARGDVAAFEALYDSTAGWLLARVRRIAGDAHAEDVLSEVYLQVWRSIAGYDDSRGQPLAWLATIARSRALDKLRCERRSHGGLADAPEGAAEEESHEVGPEQLLAAAERALLLQTSLGALSAKEQLVLGMAYFRDCSQAEIASLTGLPLGSVKTLMTRSQHKLRAVLGGARP